MCFCKKQHPPSPDKFCHWCLSEVAGEVRKVKDSVYHIWRKDRSGRRICRACYEILIRREKAVGIVHVSYRNQLKESIIRMKYVMHST